jgi:hypothetical protein
MLDTGFPQADAENDFLRARRRQFLATLAHRLRHQPADSDRLLTLDEVTGALGVRGERQLGLQTIPLDTIVGTVDSLRDFDRHFRPTSNRVRYRWEQLALAQRRGQAIPPIEVYRAGGLHFVSDGHHRVSIAAATGQQTIDAYVTEILTAVPPNGTTRPLAAQTRQPGTLNGPSAGLEQVRTLGDEQIRPDGPRHFRGQHISPALAGRSHRIAVAVGRRARVAASMLDAGTEHCAFTDQRASHAQDSAQSNA